jgi:hypothetical protein
MNLRTFARQIVTDPLYRQSIIDRAKAGTLPPDVEELIWSIADLRVPLARSVHPCAPDHGRTPTLAFTRAPLSADELDARRLAAALEGDVAQVAALNQQENKL